MRKLFLPLALVVSLVFSACNDISTDSGSERLLFGNKAYLTCSVGDIARKVSPVNVTKVDIAKVELLYKNTSGSGEATLLHEWEAECDTDDSGAKTITKNAVDVMTEETSRNPLDIDAGTYDFTLKLYVLNPLDTDESVLTQVGTITAKEIKAGENPLSFNTKYTDGNGTLDVKLSWASGMPVAKVQAGLFSVNAETLSMGAEVEGFVLSDVELIDDSARYAKSVPTGMYYLKFNVYQEETDDEPINSWSDLVKIISGATTSKEVTLSSLNIRYSINYALGEEGAWKDGFEPTEIRNANTGVVLPTADVVTRTGYVLVGWALCDADGTEIKDDDNAVQVVTMITATTAENDTAKDYYLKAQWVPITYAIVFDANGGTGTMENMTATYDDTEAALPENGFERTGYTFEGWAKTKDGDIEFSDKDALVNLSEAQDDTITLYAIWEAIAYTIAFNANSDDASGSMDNVDATYDEEFALPKNTFERTGYTFAGWATSADGAVEYADSQDKVKNLSAESDALVTLYAKWTANSVGISVTLETIEKDPELDFAYDPDTKTFTVDGDYDVYAWSMGGETVGSTSSYTVASLGAGSYTMTLAVMKDGDILTGTATFTITVVEQQTTFSVTMETIADDEGKVTVSASDTTLVATTTVAGVTSFAWTIDGTAVESTESTLDVSDYSAGTHDVTVAVADAGDVYTVQGEFTITK